MLLCGSIIRSNLFQRSSQNEQKKVLEQLFTASKEKTYLKLLTYSFVVDLLETLSENDFKKIVFPFIKSEIMKDWSEHNLDSLYLLLKVKGKYESLLKGIKLGENNLKELSSILMVSKLFLLLYLNKIPVSFRLFHALLLLSTQYMSLLAKN